MKPRRMWQRYRDTLCDLPELGFRLDLSRMDLPEDYIEGMSEGIERSFDAMAALERGGIANPDEERMVGHYWLRAPELAPGEEMAAEIRETVARVIDFSARVHRGEIRPPRAERFERVLVVGIGGSALGPQFVADALGSEADLLRPSFLDNTDPDGIDRVLAGIGDELDRTLTIVISKSGGTPETRNGMLETLQAYREKGLGFGPHAVAVTQNGSKLDRFADREGFLERFPLWSWVGGRTSETSVVGLLPAALQGIHVSELLSGAAAMDRATRTRSVRENPAALMALAWYHAGGGRGAKDMVILPYKDRLSLFSRYLQQLVMESLGKESDLDGNVVNQGIAVYGNKGSTDQHAYVQQLRDGVANFFVTFIGVARDREGASLEVEKDVTSGDYLHGLMLGTRQALHDNGRGSMTIGIERVDAATVGGLIALYERAVGLYAGLIHINAYHQPGVEAGKQAASVVIDIQRALLGALRQGQSGTCEDLAKAIGRADAVETVFHVLEHLAANPERGVTRRRGDSPFEAVFAARP